MDEPLIYTTAGNVPEASLTLTTTWEIVPDRYMKVTRTWRDAAGDVVKQSADVLDLRGLSLKAVAKQL